jgi:glycosyltransferase involved in cell wall biosynthesis
MKFSVLTTSCDYLNYLSEALDSVIEGAYEDFELIVYDDASNDDSYSYLMANYGNKPNIKINASNVRRGQANSLNNAFMYSSGDYIVLLDADDSFLPHKLKTISEFVSTRPNVGFIQHDLLEIDQNGSPLGTRFGVNSSATGCKLYGGNSLGRILDQDAPYSWFFAPTSGLCLRSDFD